MDRDTWAALLAEVENESEPGTLEPFALRLPETDLSILEQMALARGLLPSVFAARLLRAAIKLHAASAK